jgi:hypothetical protein
MMKDYNKYFEGKTTRTQKQYSVLKTERMLQGINNSHSKEICGAKDRENDSSDKQPALQGDHMQC